jgi:hypothetical protein
MTDLLERPVTFDYDYQMRCPACQGLTGLASATYDAEPKSAHMTCGHCGSDIHFGPAVMGCRDANDPTVGDLQVAAFAWYHTSTDPDWPPHEVSIPDSAFERLGMHMTPTTRAVQRHLTNQALHVGTYEAAVESMLRRMCDQGDGGSQFYLFRVRLRSGLRLEAGWRDENQAEAAQITQPDLENAGLDGIRYLNVHESPGSISLAVQRSAVAAVQPIEIPAEDLRVQVPPSLLSRIADLRTQIDALDADRSPELDVLETIRQRAAERRGEPFVREATGEQHELADLAGQALIDEFLPEVSLPVRSRFTAAMGAWTGAQESVIDDAAYARRFAAIAALLARSHEVLGLLGDRPWREPA